MTWGLGEKGKGGSGVAQFWFIIFCRQLLLVKAGVSRRFMRALLLLKKRHAQDKCTFSHPMLIGPLIQRVHCLDKTSTEPWIFILSRHKGERTGKVY